MRSPWLLLSGLAVVLPAVAWGQERPWDWGHPMMWGWGMGMMVMMLVFWGGLIAVVVFLARGFGTRPTQGEHQRREPDRREPDAREILAERFARGEISEDEFEQRRRVLEHTPS